MHSNPQITIAVACYNERNSIEATLDRLCSALQRNKLSWEIWVMDDASKDDSVNIVAYYIKKNNSLPIKHHTNSFNQGLEWNVFKAVSLAKGEYFWIVGGDNTMSIATIDTLLSHIGDADLIIPQVTVYNGRKVSRKIISKLYVFIVNFLSGYNISYYNGSAIYPHKLIKEYCGKISGFGYSAELIINLLDRGISYVEIPVEFNDKQHGKSNAINIKNIKAIFKFFLRLLFRRVKRLFRCIASPVAALHKTF